MKLLSYFMESKKSVNENDLFDNVPCFRQKPTMFLRLDLFLCFQWKVVVEVVEGDPPMMCPLQRPMHFATDPAGQVPLSVFLLEKWDISRDLCTLQQTQQDRYPFLFFYWKSETYPGIYALCDRPSRTGTPFCFSTGKVRHIQGSMDFATDPAGQVPLSVFLLEKWDISRDLCTLQQTQQDRYPFLFFYWKSETYPGIYGLCNRPSRTGTPFCFSTGKGSHIQGSMHFATDPAGQVPLSVFLLEKWDISSDLWTLQQTQQDRYPFLFFYWKRETYPVSLTLFFFLSKVMTRYQKISHISKNLTLSKTFNFEDAYHLKISQSSDHHWKIDYIVGHLTQDYSDVGRLTPEYGHEKMTLCHQVPQLSLSVGPTLPS